jgi:hypothetical protein
MNSEPDDASVALYSLWEPALPVVLATQTIKDSKREGRATVTRYGARLVLDLELVNYRGEHIFGSPLSFSAHNGAALFEFVAVFIGGTNIGQGCGMHFYDLLEGLGDGEVTPIDAPPQIFQ